MSLGGLALGIGLVSDVGVIVLDLLHRAFGKRDTAPEPEETGKKAATIAGSSIASTLTTALVFVPVIFLPGPLGSLFGDIAIALTASIFAGWLYAQFCLPSLYRLFFRPITTEMLVKQPAGPMNKPAVLQNFLETKYRSILIGLLRRPAKIFAAAAMASVLGALSLFLRPVVFISPDEAEEVRVSAVFPPGTLLQTAGNAGTALSRLVSRLPSVKTVYGKAGAEEEDVSRRADIDYRKEELVLRCVLEKGVKPEKAMEEIRSALERSFDPGVLLSVYLPRDRTEILLGLSQERTYAISGKDRDELIQRAAIAEDTFKVSAIPVSLRPKGQRPELRMYPNREAAAYLSMSAANIAETLYTLNEGMVAVTLEIEGRPLDVRVTGQRDSAEAGPVRLLEQIPLRTPEGKTVYLGSLGRIERREAEAALARLDRCDVMYLDTAATKDNTVLDTAKKITARYSWFARADESVFSRYRNSLLLYVILVLILLYMTMGAQFESFLLPLILMMSIPFSLAGAGPTLLATGTRIDSGAVLGLAALFGLVVNNSLVLFEISDEKIRQGRAVAPAVYSGASQRLQAVLITAATTVFALLPLAISPLGNSQKSMAAAMMGGLTASSLLSLFAIPPVLIRFFAWKLRKQNLSLRGAIQ
jgi:multidrug efflux pump subunit AcrB